MEIEPIVYQALVASREDNLAGLGALARPGARLGYGLVTGPLLKPLVRVTTEVAVRVAQKALGKYVAPLEAFVAALPLDAAARATAEDYLSLLKTPASMFSPHVRAAVG